MTSAATSIPVIAVVGWKKSGKTTLVVRLISEFARRGVRVATVKHAHHAFQIDDGDTDSAHHRRAGASQVAIVAAKRWAIVTELEGAPEPSLTEVISRLGPCDLIIVEGYKSASIPKIEARRAQAISREPLAGRDPYVIAVAADHAADGGGKPVFQLDDIGTLVDFIARAIGLAGMHSPSPVQAPART
jgi:molybdopterin-guanine dinucleotide biosynthesis adapter protein